MAKRTLLSNTYEAIYERFTAPVAKRHDCGRYCAPLNGGSPVCCSPAHAIPIVSKEEWRALKSRTKLWRRFKPVDAAGRQIVEELDSSCVAVECKGAAFCERDNRSLSCRTFPLFPYHTKEKAFVGLAGYWSFEDRCWVLSNLRAVDRAFLDEMCAVYDLIFEEDPEEREPFIEQSVQMRRQFSRWGRPIPLLGRDGALLRVPPKSGGRIEPAALKDFGPQGPYRSKKAFLEAVRDFGYEPPAASDLPEGLFPKKRPSSGA